jgi:hypothetical protein
MVDGFWPWFEQVSARIPSTWYHPTVMRKCDYADYLKGCSAKAVGMCRVCKKDVCLSHAFIGLDASLVCLSCILEAAKHVAAKDNEAPKWEDHSPPPAAKPKVDLKAAYAVLGVEQGCDQEELERAYKKLLAKWHPDRVKTPEKKKQYELKFKQIRSAYDAIASKK